MEHQRTARILIVAQDALLQSVYGAILESNNYVLHSSTYTSPQLTFDPVPDLIVLHYTIDFHGMILDLLEEVHRVYDEASRPLLLIVAPKDWADPVPNCLSRRVQDISRRLGLFSKDGGRPTSETAFQSEGVDRFVEVRVRWLGENVYSVSTEKLR